MTILTTILIQMLPCFGMTPFHDIRAIFSIAIANLHALQSFQKLHRDLKLKLTNKTTIKCAGIEIVQFSGKFTHYDQSNVND